MEGKVEGKVVEEARQEAVNLLVILSVISVGDLRAISILTD